MATEEPFDEIIPQPEYEQYDPEGNLEWKTGIDQTGDIHYIGNDLFLLATTRGIFLFRRNAKAQTFNQEATILRPVGGPTLFSFLGVTHDRGRIFIARFNSTIPQSATIVCHELAVNGKQLFTVGAGFTGSMRGATWDHTRRKSRQRGGFFYSIRNNNTLLQYQFDGNSGKLSNNSVSLPSNSQRIAFDGKAFWIYRTGVTNNLVHVERNGTVIHDFPISGGVDGIAHDGRSICVVK